MRRGALLGLLLALLAAPAAALAAPGASVEVDGRRIDLGVQQLAADADVPPTAYLVDGTPRELSGISVRRLVSLAGASADAVSAVTAEGADRALLQLTAPDLAAGAFGEGEPLVWTDEQGRTSILRPRTDDQPATIVSSAPGSPLLVRLDGTTLLEVSTPMVSTDRPRVGEKVSMRASAVGGEGELTYIWTFDDGATAEGREVRHAFARPGSYRVRVSVADAAGGGGSSPAVTIRVGKPAPDTREKPRTGTGSGRGGTGADSPGGATGVAGAEAHSPSGATGVAGAGAHSPGGGAGTGASGAGAAPALSASPEPAAPAPAPAAEPAERKPPEPAEPEPEPDPEPPAPPPAEPTVSGTLLADASGSRKAALPAAAAAARSAAAEEEGGLSPSPALVVALGAAALFSAGVATERRRRVRP